MDSVESRSWGFSGFCGILPESLGFLGDSLGFFEKCTRFLKCRIPRFKLKSLDTITEICFQNFKNCDFSVCCTRQKVQRKSKVWTFHVTQSAGYQNLKFMYEH